MVSRQSVQKAALCALLMGSASGAKAATVNGSGVVVGQSQGRGDGTPVLDAPHLAPRLESGGHVYDLSVAGILTMCQDTPALCALPVQQQTLADLHKRQAIGSVMAIGGIGIMVAGPVASLAVNCGRGQRCEPNWVVAGASLGGGALFSLIGALIAPTRRELIDFVDTTNASQSIAPVHLEFGGVGGGSPALLVVGNL